MLREGLNEFEEEVIPWGANSLYGGGPDTVRVDLASAQFGCSTLINMRFTRLLPH